MICNINLKSYFMNSMFHDGLLYPIASNIAPKFDEDQDLSTGYKYRRRSFGTKDFNVNTVKKSEKEETIKGDFEVYDKKEFDYYWNSETGKYVYMGSSKSFGVLDKGNFLSEVGIIDEDTIKITTSIDLKRIVTGDNLDDKSIRDGLFPNIPHENSEENVEIVEYFVVLANGNRLLHFSPLSDFFEVFSLVSTWTLGKSISEFDSPKVFDDLEYDHVDQDLDEIKDIITKYKEVKKLKK